MRGYHLRISSPLAVLVAIALPALGLAQRASDAMEAVTRARVAALSQRLQVDERDPIAKARYYADLPEVTRLLHEEIDRDLMTLDARAPISGEVEARLRRVLSEHVIEPAFGDPPFARVKELLLGRSLVAAYTIIRPPHHHIATVRGYRESADGKFQLVATAADDFEDFYMFKAELAPPFAGELWLLTWGQARTFNGSKFRIRVISFDGASFRTVWSPEDIYNVNVRLEDPGFVITHIPPGESWPLEEAYALASTGPVKVRSVTLRTPR